MANGRALGWEKGSAWTMARGLARQNRPPSALPAMPAMPSSRVVQKPYSDLVYVVCRFCFGPSGFSRFVQSGRHGWRSFWMSRLSQQSRGATSYRAACQLSIDRCRHGSSSWNGKQKWSSASRACPTSSPALACLRLCSPRLRLESGAFGTDRWRAGTRQRREQPSASLRPKASVSPSLR
jgi:hypothetical protein